MDDGQMPIGIFCAFHYHITSETNCCFAHNLICGKSCALVYLYIITCGKSCALVYL